MLIIFIITTIIFIIATIFYRKKYITALANHSAIENNLKKLTHLLRNATGTIYTGTLGIKKYLPTLLKSYSQSNVESEDISPARLTLLNEALTNIEIAVEKINNHINKI
jgi:hypothetical protein